MTSKHGQPWSNDDRRTLVAMDMQHKHNECIAQALGRTPYAVECQRDLLQQQGTYNSFKKSIAPQSQEEKTMTNNTMVTTEVKIGNTPASKMTIVDILVIIEQEEALISRLESFKTQSKAITKLITRHRNNLDALVTIIDNRDE